jgi:hypothetical protein
MERTPAPRPAILWLMLTGAGLLALLVANTTGEVKFPSAGEGLPDEFWAALQSILVAAVMVERSVDVYLRATGNEPVVLGVGAAGEVIKSKDIRPLAGITAAIISLIIAASGLRLLDTLMELPAVTAGSPEDTWPNAMRNWLFVLGDIVISAGLIAGGAKVAHPLLEGIIGVLDGFKINMNRAKDSTQPQRVERYLDGPTASIGPYAPHLGSTPGARSVMAQTFSITVLRGTGGSGTLTFSHGGVDISTTCYWDNGNRIAAASYTGCSATRMATKTDPQNPDLKRMGIYLPGAVSPNTGAADIFIHEGPDASWSDGCIVLPRAQMEAMWNAITPKDAANVTVLVADE